MSFRTYKLITLAKQTVVFLLVSECVCGLIYFSPSPACTAYFVCLTLYHCLTFPVHGYIFIFNFFRKTRSSSGDGGGGSGSSEKIKIQLACDM